MVWLRAVQTLFGLRLSRGAKVTISSDVSKSGSALRHHLENPSARKIPILPYPIRHFTSQLSINNKETG